MNSNKKKKLILNMKYPFGNNLINRIRQQADGYSI
jgi:hypothetical protein